MRSINRDKKLEINILRAWFMRRLMRKYAHAFAVNVSDPASAKEAENYALKMDSRRRDTYIKEYHVKHSSEPQRQSRERTGEDKISTLAGS
jgi:hypothetical protein